MLKSKFLLFVKLWKPLTSFGLLALFSYSFFSIFKDIKTQSTVFNTWTDDLSADCAVVLTGGPQRVREGFDLLSQRKVKKLVVSGVNPASRLTDIFPLWPYYGNVKKEDIVLEKFSTTTYGNARYSVPLLESLNCRQVIVVTSSVHMRRALKTFSAQVAPSSLLRFEPGSVYPGQAELNTPEIIGEAFKSLFYAFWAY